MALLRRWWAQQDNAFMADQAARSEERASCDEKVNRLRADHEAEMKQIRADHVLEVAELRRSFDRRFNAMARALREIVLLVPDGDNRAKATEVLLQLSIDEGEA